MKSLMSLVAGLSAFSLLTAASIAAESMPGAKTEPNAGFERMKPLVGNWDGKASDGKAVKISYALVSGGSALLETIQAESALGMVTVYHPDGDRLMMTHYCSLNNQPRMRTDTAPAENGKLVFHFVDATNMASPGAMHMHKLVITFVDKDHIVQEWTWKGGEKEGTEVFRLERMK